MSNIPNSFYRGEKIDWTETYTGLDPASITLKCIITKLGVAGVFIQLSSTPGSNLGFNFSLPASESVKLDPGKCLFVIGKEDGSEVLEQGEISILENLILVAATATETTTFDPRTTEQKVDILDQMLEAVEQAILEMLTTGGFKKVTIGSRTLENNTIEELRAFRSDLLFQKQSRKYQGMPIPIKIKIKR